MSGFGWESSGGGGGSLPSGFLQVAGGVPLDGTLRTITDGVGNTSPLQLSTTQVGFEQSSAGYINRWYNSGGTANSRKYAVYVANNYWSLTTRNDAEDSGEQFLIATALAGNLSTLELGKSISPLILSTQLATLASSNLVVGHTTASARLHVRGDGTNPIFRLESTSGTQAIRLIADGSTTYFGSGDAAILVTNNSSVAAINGASFAFQSALTSGAQYGHKYYNIYSHSWTSGTGGIFDVGSMGGTFAAAAGSGNFRPINIAYTINNSGAQTGTATGIFLNATETALNGMGHNLMDLQRDGTSRAKITNAGRLDLLGDLFAPVIWATNGVFRGNNTGTRLTTTVDGIWLMQDNAGTSFNRLQLGGTTNAFPAIKRNGAAIDFRLADDSGYCGIIAGRSTEKTIEVVEVGGAMGLGFFNTAATDQPTTAISEATYISSGGGGSQIRTGDTIGGYTLQQVVQALQNLGLLA
jgi:hypothetical protein